MKNWSTKSGYNIIQVLSGRSNVFLLGSGRTKILIDTGPGFMWKTLKRRLDHLQISKIDLLILTHSHFDHAANAEKIRIKYNARVIIHKSESNYLSNGDNILPAGTNAITRRLIRLFSKQFISSARYGPCKDFTTVDDTLPLSEYGLNAYLMNTPGHTPGSISVIIDNEIALVGDTMFGVFPWTVLPPFANYPTQLIDSWGKLLETNCKLFIPSHGSANPRTLVEKDLKRRKNSQPNTDIHSAII
jgi:hydroxyacylglutathione hydrolase